MENYIDEEENKVYIVGANGTGKTTLSNILTNQDYQNVSPSKLGIVSTKVTINKKNFTIKDMTDDSNFRYTKYFKDEIEEIRLIIIMFSLNDRSSLDYAKELIALIYSTITNNKIQILLCGNKSDIADSNIKADQDLINNKAENLEYVEISCITNQGINKIKGILQEFTEAQDEESKINDESDVSAKGCLVI